MLRLLAGIPKLEAPLHDLAGLSCADHGGPSNDHAAEMVYWSDIPSDADFKSPIGANDKSIKYLTFEPDGGGFNNIRDKMVNSGTTNGKDDQTTAVSTSDLLATLKFGSNIKEVEIVLIQKKRIGRTNKVSSFS
jgi:hypothetical protein